jgi:hypothetical protein
MFDDILRQRSVIGLSSVCHRSVIGLSSVCHRLVTGPGGGECKAGFPISPSLEPLITLIGAEDWSQLMNYDCINARPKPPVKSAPPIAFD